MGSDTRPSRATTSDWRAGLLAGITLRPPEPAAHNRLGWPDYDGRPALRWGDGLLAGVPAVVAAWDFGIHGGSFGERDAAGFAAAATAAAASRRPLVSFLRSGGTRLQEGVAGLVGLPRAALALAALDAAGVGHLAVADQPTTGGVWVTIGSRSDLRCAVLGATVGFAGPRVVTAVTGTPPPPSSHTATAAFAAGLVDAALPPELVEPWLRRALTALTEPPPRRAAARSLRASTAATPTTGSPTAAARPGSTNGASSNSELARGEAARDTVTHEAVAHGGAARTDAGRVDEGRVDEGRAVAIPAGYERIAERSGWAQVQAARGADRPDATDVLRALLPHGVDLVGPDPLVLATVGIVDLDPAGAAPAAETGTVSGTGTGIGVEIGTGGERAPVRAVAVAIGARRGAAPGPAGYRLLSRAAGLAGKLGIGLITLVDTPGAANGAEAEADGIAAAIGDAMAAVLACPSPTVSIVVGEGGSGGALAAAVTDLVAMTPNSYFTALSPEGTAVTLRVPVERAADVSGLRPTDLYTLGFADRLLTSTTATEVARDAAALLDSLAGGDPTERLRRRQSIWSTGLRNSL